MIPKRVVSTFILISSLLLHASAQKEVKHTRQGNREYRDVSFEDAELSYRRSIEVNPEYRNALFNLGDAQYKQEKYEDALKSFSSLAESEIDFKERSETYYNMGNTLLKNQKLKESIEAYKNSLRLDPSNKRAKYNLGYAQDLLKEEEKQQQEQQDNQENQDQNNDDKESDQDKEQENNEDNKDENSEEDKSDQPQDQDKESDQDPKEENKKDQQMSQQDAERLLQALAADEQEVQEKVKKAKAAKNRVRTLKNW